MPLSITIYRDVSLLRSEGVSQANYSGIQQELIDLGAVDVRLLDNARVLFLENCQKRMSTRPWNCSRIRPKPYQAPSDSSLPPPYFGKFIDQSKFLNSRQKNRTDLITFSALSITGQCLRGKFLNNDSEKNFCISFSSSTGACVLDDQVLHV